MFHSHRVQVVVTIFGPVDSFMLNLCVGAIPPRCYYFRGAPGIIIFAVVIELKNHKHSLRKIDSILD